jgi:hypothetical protein
MLGAKECCRVLLEFLDLFAADEVLPRANTLERFLDFVLDLGVLPLQVERRNGRANGGTVRCGWLAHKPKFYHSLQRQLGPEH